MSTHLRREGGPVQSFIQTEAPSYEPWYWQWREARNRIKRGVNFGLTGTWEDLGISFSTFIPEGGGVMIDHSEVVKLTDLIEALGLSAQLHRAITRRAIETQTATCPHGRRR